MQSLWRWLRTLLDFLTLLRIPTLIVVLGVLLSTMVAQVGELIDISLDPGLRFQRLIVVVFALGLGLVVWITARSLVAFDLPILRHSHERWRSALGQELPRLLGAAVPLTLAVAYYQALPYAQDQGRTQTLMVVAMALGGVGLWVFTFKRRALWERLSGRPGTKPKVASLQQFRELGPLWHWHWMGIFALVLSWLVAWIWPHWLSALGPIPCILGAALLFVWASTLPVYWASRRRFPLLTAVFLWACALTWADLNDNHAVRVYADQNSQQIPEARALYTAQTGPDMAQYVRLWNAQRTAQCPGGPILVSSEGGGIRAAMWTVIVLGELDRRTNGQVSRCILAMSGVSGGSLGLAAAAMATRDQPDPDQRARRLIAMMEADLLSPLLGSLFGLDQLQRVVPMRLFSDRGQALEDAFVRAYENTVRAVSEDSPFAAGWEVLYPPAASVAELPILLLNSTVVATGERVIQHGFAPLEDFAERFPAAIDGATWFPPTLPLAHAVHNSARFTFASPAGTVYQMPVGDTPFKPAQLLGQVVDGGYFENSGTTTLAEFSRWLSAEQLLDPSAFTAIHISNDPGVEQVGPNDDDCAGDAYLPSVNSALRKDGELLAPVNAILSTRSARGQLARQNWADSTGDRLWHFRLCNGPREVPLGWFIGPGTTAELRRQLLATGDDGQRDPRRPLTNLCQLEALAGQFGAGLAKTDGCK